MQIARVETNAGTAICAAPSRIARLISFPCPRLRWMFSISTVEVDLLPLPQIAVDVLDLDRRVVDEHADRERQAAQRHEVERLAEELQHDDRDQDRQRDGDCDDDGAPPAAEEEQDHEARQHGRDRRLDQDALQRRLDEEGLVEEGPDLEPRRERLLDALQLGLELVDDVEGRRAAVLQGRQEHGALAVLPHDVRLHLEAVAHLGDVAQDDGRAADLLDREVVQRIDHFRAAVEADVVLALAHLERARGQDQVLEVDRLGDVPSRQPLGGQLDRVDVDHDLAGLAAERRRHGGALDGEQLRAEIVEAVVENLLLRERVAGDAHLDDRNGRGAVPEDERRVHPRREDAEQGLADGAALCHGGLDLRPGIEEDLDVGEAVHGLRFDVLDVVHVARERPLGDRDDPLLHLVGRHAGVGPDDADDGDVDLGVAIVGHPEDGEDADEEDDERGDDEGVGPSQRQTDDPHGTTHPPKSPLPGDPTIPSGVQLLTLERR
jgi:hypothetical protein